MNEDRSPDPHYAVMVHFLDDAARYLFDAEEDSDFATLGEYCPARPGIHNRGCFPQNEVLSR